MTRLTKVLDRIPVFPHEGLSKTIYNSILIFAALAGTIITSYRLTFRIHDTDLHSSRFPQNFVEYFFACGRPHRIPRSQ